MKSNQSFGQQEDAITPTIGVILMVAATVSMGAVVYVLASDQGGDSAEGPSVAFDERATGEHTVLKADPGLTWSEFTITGCNALSSASGPGAITDGAAQYPNDPVAAGNVISDCLAGIVVRHTPTNTLVYKAGGTACNSAISLTGTDEVQATGPATYSEGSDYAVVSELCSEFDWNDFAVRVTNAPAASDRWHIVCVLLGSEPTVTQLGSNNPSCLTGQPLWWGGPGTSAPAQSQGAKLLAFSATPIALDDKVHFCWFHLASEGNPNYGSGTWTFEITGPGVAQTVNFGTDSTLGQASNNNMDRCVRV